MGKDGGKRGCERDAGLISYRLRTPGGEEIFYCVLDFDGGFTQKFKYVVTRLTSRL